MFLICQCYRQNKSGGSSYGYRVLLRSNFCEYADMLICVCLVQLNSKVLKGVKITGICTQQLHTVLWCKDTVYTFGQNAGQLGNLA